MNIGEIAERFIRAAEVERASHEHVGPAPLRAQQLPYVHDHVDKNGWGKSPLMRVVKKGRLIQGDWLEVGEDPLAEERKAFWERLGLMPTSEELSQLEGLYDMLIKVDDHGERRALLAWARAKVGGKAFRRWCFQVEGIHPETGRRRKDRALAKISTALARSDIQNSKTDCSTLLPCDHEISDILDTVEEDAGRREGLNNWAADDAFSSFIAEQKHDFSWAQKRNEMRRRQREKKRQQAA
ncbi:hypothetical protein C5748_18320 [Phyllobacterium phragmitis]|uniref:Uncharacterized protein n=1 Tax=Phyllobacterium phragmitis TaxID=2670329 RepID=A0A2S9INK5_9HYPH|nr:hypothetical protein [Phyllobacterium phragmitis]PRD42107.1 hypothetical protein C5748_18320 [Phyllobacterium phragmitis]